LLAVGREQGSRRMSQDELDDFHPISPFLFAPDFDPPSFLLDRTFTLFDLAKSIGITSSPDGHTAESPSPPADQGDVSDKGLDGPCASSSLSSFR